MDDIERQKQVLLRRMGAIEQELEKLEALPVDNYPELTVIRFKLSHVDLKRRPSVSPYFNYAVLKVNGYWYLTGMQTRVNYKMTWTQLQEWWSNNRVKKIRMATEWSKLDAFTPAERDGEDPVYDDRATD